jgi:hypothetical protein
MTEEELDEIERRALAAGPGLWRGERFCSDEDFRFIGAARQDIPRLVEVARRS